MSIILKDQGKRSELQQRITAELREKQLRKGAIQGDIELESPNTDVEKNEYMKDFKSTTTLSWAWLLIGIAVIGIIAAIIIGLDFPAMFLSEELYY